MSVCVCSFCLRRFLCSLCVLSFFFLSVYWCVCALIVYDKNKCVNVQEDREENLRVQQKDLVGFV